VHAHSNTYTHAHIYRSMMSLCEKVAHHVRVHVCAQNSQQSPRHHSHPPDTLVIPSPLHSQDIQQRGAALLHIHSHTHACTPGHGHTDNARTHFHTDRQADKYMGEVAAPHVGVYSMGGQRAHAPRRGLDSRVEILLERLSPHLQHPVTHVHTHTNTHTCTGTHAHTS
jgi:hypothetical protein